VKCKSVEQEEERLRDIFSDR